MRIIVIALFAFVVSAACTTPSSKDAVSTVRAELKKSILSDYAVSLSLDTIFITRQRDMVSYLSATTHSDLTKHNVMDSMYRDLVDQYHVADGKGAGGTQLLLRDIDMYDWLLSAQPSDIFYVMYRYDLDVTQNVYQAQNKPIGIYYFIDRDGAIFGNTSTQFSGLADSLGPSRMDSVREYYYLMQRHRYDTKELKWLFPWE
jgi:hypothetical protein